MLIGASCVRRDTDNVDYIRGSLLVTGGIFEGAEDMRIRTKTAMLAPGALDGLLQALNDRTEREEREAGAGRKNSATLQEAQLYLFT